MARRFIGRPSLASPRPPPEPPPFWTSGPILAHSQDGAENGRAATAQDSGESRNVPSRRSWNHDISFMDNLMRSQSPRQPPPQPSAPNQPVEAGSLLPEHGSRTDRNAADTSRWNHGISFMDNLMLSESQRQPVPPPTDHLHPGLPDPVPPQPAPPQVVLLQPQSYIGTLQKLGRQWKGSEYRDLNHRFLRNVATGRHSIGEMDSACQHCNALHWLGESTKSPAADPKYHMCCAKGKVLLPEIRDPPEDLRHLLSSAEPAARSFRKDSRKWNSVLQIASTGKCPQAHLLPAQAPCFPLLSGTCFPFAHSST